MVFSSADIVLFGIQAGVRMFGAARQAYVEKTRERALTLPLPGLDHTAGVGQAQSYFDLEGKRHLSTSARLRALHEACDADRVAFERDAVLAAEYVQAFVYFRGVDRGLVQNGLAPADVLAVTTIAQWRRGEAPHPTALKRIAGTLVEIGIDYFANGPGRGRLTGDAPARRLLRTLLDALDDHAFSTDGLDGVVETLFLATLDAIANDPAMVADDPKLRDFVAAVAKGLVADLDARLVELGPERALLEGEQLGRTAGLVFRSLLRHGAGHALTNPAAFLGTDDDGEAALVSRVGTAILDTILPSAHQPLDLTAVMSGDGIDAVVRSALAVVAEHPDLLGLRSDGTSAIRTLLGELADELLASTEPLGPDLLPELLRLLLDKTAGNLHLLWDADGDTEHVLQTAMRALLTGLAAEPADGVAWRPAFTRRLLLDVAEAVLDEVVRSPGLITDRIGTSLPLEAAIHAVLAELARLELDDLSADTVVAIVKAAVRAAAMRLDFLDRIKIGSSAVKPVLAHVLEAILAAAFPAGGESPRAVWTLARSEVLQALVEAALDRLASAGVDARRIAALRDVLDETVRALEDRQAFSLAEFTRRLDSAIAA